MARQRARDARALALATRERDAALADQLVDAIGKSRHFLGHAHAPHEVGRFCFIERAVRSEAQVVAVRFREEEAVLRNVADRAAHGGERELADRDAVEQDLPLGFEQPAHEVEERRLARTGRAHDAKRRAGRNDEIDAGDRVLPGIRIPEVHAAQLDLPAHLGKALRRGRIGEVARLGEELVIRRALTTARGYMPAIQPRLIRARTP